MGRGNLAGTEQRHRQVAVKKHPEKVGVGHLGSKPRLVWNNVRENTSSKLEFLLFDMPHPECPIQISKTTL